MSKEIQLDKKEARKLVLHAQGLNQPQQNSLQTIQQLSYVQIDTISVAERAHHHVFFTRNQDYTQPQLDQMMTDKVIFEYWSHAAAFLPMDDYRFSLYTKGEIAKAGKFWFDADKKMMRHVLKRIRAEGPLQSKDFEHPKGEAPIWYEWKPAKIALHELFMAGKLMVSGRQGFQKIYDLTERVVPDYIDKKRPTEKQFCGYLIDRAIASQGIVAASEIAHLRKGLKKSIVKVLEDKVRKREIIPTSIKGVSTEYYTIPSCLDLIPNTRENTEVHLLCPFDPLVIQRNRPSQIFDFEYTIECYVPEKKRKYGYYVLPILYGDRFVGRLDPKADRKTGKFYVRKIWLEDGFEPDEAFFYAFTEKIKAFAKFCGCMQIVLEKAFPNKYKTEFKRWLRS